MLRQSAFNAKKRVNRTEFERSSKAYVNHLLQFGYIIITNVSMITNTGHLQDYG